MMRRQENPDSYWLKLLLNRLGDLLCQAFLNLKPSSEAFDEPR